LPLGVKRGDETRQVTLTVGSRAFDQEKIGYSCLKANDERITVKDVAADKPVTLTVRREDGTTVDIQATPRMNEGDLKLGFTQTITGRETVNQRLGLIPALKFSVNENIRIVQLTKTALAQVFVGKRSARDTLTGPVGIAQIVGQAAQEGPGQVLRLTGLLS